MTGSLQVKNGKYYAVIRFKDSSNKQKQRWISTGYEVKNNKRKAEQKLKDIISELENQGNKELPNEADDACLQADSCVVVPAEEADNPSGTLLWEYVERWMRVIRQRDRLEENTYQGYESICNKHIIPYFKPRKTLIEDITPDLLQEFIDYERANGNSKKGKTELSRTSLKRIKIVLGLVFKEARRDGLLTTNPTEFLVLPKSVKRDVTYYNEKQLKTLFDSIRDEDIFPIIYVTVLYGLRRSEVLGLKWDSVDFENKTVTIKHTVVRFSDVIEKDRTKTASSYRTYPLPEEIERIFLQQKEKEKLGRKKYGELYEENDYIFKWDYGRMYNPDFITRKFSKLLKANGLPHIRFHDLRHSCASLLISKGFTLKDIQEWLGHADIETTANIYAHLDQERKNKIMASISF